MKKDSSPPGLESDIDPSIAPSIGPSPGPAINGRPGQSARAWGLWHAAAPISALLFVAGFVLGSALRPPGLEGTAAGVLLLAIAVGLALVGRNARQRLGRHQRGAAGEEKVARALETLPEGWHVFHGVPLFNRGDGGGKDADHVVIGPNGIFLVETVNWTGRISVEAGEILDQGKAYPGYTLEAIQSAAEDLGELLAGAEDNPPVVKPLFCAAGGRYAPGVTDRTDVIFREPETLIETLLTPGRQTLTAAEVTRHALTLKANIEI
ncbi:MAG: NERD domain-containing protein [Verrucomicrobia bacterium]|nr:NERD domain-containing protein [Verrucomicrobiota bacterium]MCH8511230.1 NERD domain-containing protein [Kiritimatiellia bacterium]